MRESEKKRRERPSDDMSWIRNAVNLAVEAGATNTLTRTVRNYADTVVLHAGNAVAGGARLLLPDRIVPFSSLVFRLTKESYFDSSPLINVLFSVKLDGLFGSFSEWPKAFLVVTHTLVIAFSESN